MCLVCTCEDIKINSLSSVWIYIKLFTFVPIRIIFRRETMLNILYQALNRSKVRLPPKEDGWYGPGARPKDHQPGDASIRPFKVNISDTVLDDLKARLENARWAPPIESTNFRYGFNTNTLKEVVEYWKTKYDWRQHESQLNRYNHYLTKIEGIDIHFVHVRPNETKRGKVVPLLAVHGWPGSFYEYFKSIDRLTDPTDSGIAFELVLPSIPGYAFSEAPHQEGFSAISAARIFVKLMARLGHDKFIAHGGDWGSAITKAIASMYPENVIGLHLHMIFRAQPQTWFDQMKMTAAKYTPNLMFGGSEKEYKYFQQAAIDTWYLEAGYFHIQSTKPDTVGIALTDSPVGLAAYILEKFSTWTNNANIDLPDGGLLAGKFSFDDLLTNVMIYWCSGSITSSLRFYRENSHPIAGALARYSMETNVPAAYAVFPNELKCYPRFMVEMVLPNLIQYSLMPRGGHFAAFEEPDLFVDDIKQFGRKLLAN